MIFGIVPIEFHPIEKNPNRLILTQKPIAMEKSFSDGKKMSGESKGNLAMIRSRKRHVRQHLERRIGELDSENSNVMTYYDMLCPIFIHIL